MDKIFSQGRDDFEALKTSLHPHLSSLASLAQGTSLSAPSSVFSLAGGSANFAYTPPAFLAPAPPPPAQPAGSASSSSSEGSAAGWSFEEQYKQVRQVCRGFNVLFCVFRDFFRRLGWQTSVLFT